MEIAEAFVKFVVKQALDKCPKELEFFEKNEKTFLEEGLTDEQKKELEKKKSPSKGLNECHFAVAHVHAYCHSHRHLLVAVEGHKECGQRLMEVFVGLQSGEKFRFASDCGQSSVNHSLVSPILKQLNSSRNPVSNLRFPYTTNPCAPREMLFFPFFLSPRLTSCLIVFVSVQSGAMI